MDAPGKGAYLHMDGVTIGAQHHAQFLIAAIFCTPATSGAAVKNCPIAADGPGKGAYFACGRRKNWSMALYSISHRRNILQLISGITRYTAQQHLEIAQ